MTIKLTLEMARRVQLAALGLLAPPERPATKEDVLACIRRMGALQIDTINVIARSPYLVLWSRLGSYDCRWLEELLAEGRLFEYWAHAACFLPVEEYPNYRRLMKDLRAGYFTPQWYENHREVVDGVLERVRTEGAVRSADFERKDGKQGTWWDWKEEKVALEYLHTHGELMIRERRNFQRIYDLRERVLPGWDDAQMPSFEDVLCRQLEQAVAILGVTPARWTPDYFRLPKRGSQEILNNLEDAGKIVRVEVEDWKEPAYVHADNAGLAETAAAGGLEPTLTTFLSPFDPLVWDRARLKGMFGFDYTIEVYTPQSKRRYGYFVLPVLHRGRLVGRIDPKAHRQLGQFEVKALHWEEGVTVTEEMRAEVLAAVGRCAEWHGLGEVVVR